MSKKRKHNYNNKRNKNETKTDSYFFIKLVAFSIICFILIGGSKLLYNLWLHDDVLYFVSIPHLITLILSLLCWLLLVYAFPVDKIRKKQLKFKKKWIIMLTTFYIIVTLLPFLLMRSGLMADNKSFKKTDLFGETKVEYQYKDIRDITIGVHKFIMYDITFTNDEQIHIEFSGYEYPSFRNNKNLVLFDKSITKYREKQVNAPNNEWTKP